MPRGTRQVGETGLTAAVELIEDQLDGTVPPPPGMAPLVDGKVPAEFIPEPSIQTNGFVVYVYTGDYTTHSYVLDGGQTDDGVLPQIWIGGPDGAPQTTVAYDAARSRAHLELPA